MVVVQGQGWVSGALGEVAGGVARALRDGHDPSSPVPVALAGGGRGGLDVEV